VFFHHAAVPAATPLVALLLMSPHQHAQREHAQHLFLARFAFENVPLAASKV